MPPLVVMMNSFLRTPRALTACFAALVAAGCTTAEPQKQADATPTPVYPRLIEGLETQTDLPLAFRTFHTFSDHDTIKANSPTPFRLRPMNFDPSSISVHLNGHSVTFEEQVAAANITSLVVVHKGAIVYENYYNGENALSRHTSMSVAKSFVSAMIGIALDRGEIDGSLTSPISDLVPALAGSAYGKPTLGDLLQMASGIAWSETYDGTDTLQYLIGTWAFGGSINNHLTALEGDHDPGTYRRYASSDTQVLGWVLYEQTGKKPSELLQSWIWEPAGMMHDAYWNTDATGMNVSFCCLAATSRDYARFGQLFLRNGFHNRRPVVPSSWVRESTNPTNDIGRPGGDARGSATDGSGYGYQWWVPGEGRGDYAALGLGGQVIYVSPALDTVVVITSADARPNASERHQIFAREVAETIAGETHR